MNIYYTLVFTSLVASQVIPTFGTSLGFLGNMIPVVFSVFLMVLAFVVRPLRINRRIGFFVLLIGFVPVTSSVSGSLIVGDVDSRLFNDISKPVLLAFFIFSGAVVARATNFNISLPLSLIASAFIINISLFIIFFIDVNSPFIELYRTRVVGGSELGRARFVGAWNFPYNLSVFLTALMVAAIASFWIKRAWVTLLCFLVVFCCIAMVLFGQSRSALITLILLPVLFLSLKFVHGVSLTKRQMKALVFFVPAILFFGFFILDRVESFLSRLMNFTYIGYDQAANLGIRSYRVVRAFDFFDAEPISLIFGFPRSSEIFFLGSFESGIEYIVIYGLIGVMFFVALPLALSLSVSYRSIFRHRTKDPGVYFLSTFLIMLSFSVLLHSPGNTIFWHFRFMPLFGFVLGWLLANERHSQTAGSSSGPYYTGR